MPWCPECGAEYRQGYTQCADCRATLLDAPPANDPLPDRVRELHDPVPIFQANSPIDAQRICEMLRNADVAAASRETELGEAIKVFTGASIYGTKVMVERAQAAWARELLALWAEQDARAPVNEEELAMLALREMPEEELARQAESEEPAELEDNDGLRGMKFALAFLAVIMGLLFVTLKMIA